MSAGYARYREGQKLEELVDAADDALYLEKKRNIMQEDEENHV